MSLIHDALRAVDADTLTTSPSPTPLQSTAGRERQVIAPRRTEWWVALGSFAVVVVAGSVAWTLWRSSQAVDASAPPVLQPQAPVATAQPASATAPLAAAPDLAPPAAPLSMAQAPAVPVASAAPEAVAQPAQAVASPTVLVPENLNKKSTPALSVPNKVAIKKEKSTPEPAAGADEDSMPVEQRFARFMAAMTSEDVPAAQQELLLLRKRLPVQAVGLLRAQAWFDLRTHNTDAAVQGYRQVLERLPGDEEAAVNLASLLSQMDRSEQAREVLAQALAIRSDSAALRNALRRFTPEARP
ncbi:tetratricopeptide repeat protein [Hydrogenophaga soli]